MAFSIISLVIASLLISPAVSSNDLASIKVWCSRTPFPHACETSSQSFLKTNLIANKLPIISRLNFFKLQLRLALKGARSAKDYTSFLGPLCRNPQEEAAWLDCLDLYEHVILKLDKALRHAGKKCVSVGIQTWISTALTDLETCKRGFIDLGVTDNILPLISNNIVMDLVRNLLYINKWSVHESGCKSGFPSRGPWMSPRPNVVVAKDGTGDFTTVNQAIGTAGNRKGRGRYVIYVKHGIYEEYVAIGSNLKNITLMGDGIGKTIITGDRSVGGTGTTTFRTATVSVVGDGFIAEGITFRNTAGPQNHQAVALRSGSDCSVFYRCSFEGYQDTLYVHSERQFFRECDIYGTVDFIFGNAAAVFEKCNIYARYPPSGTNTLTAQGRTDPRQNTGISIQDCRVMAAPDLKPAQSDVKTYLGRPWQKYSRTVFMKTYLDSLIDPVGWTPWDGNFALDTLFYGEYENTGPGAGTSRRVRWPECRVISESEASKFTVANFIAGNHWLPETDVPYAPGLE